MSASLRVWGDLRFVVNSAMPDTIEPLAVRSDRLFLFRHVARTADGLELAVLSLVELGPSGLV